MNFDLTSTQQSIQQRARQFAQEEVAPFARETDESGEFPLHLVKRMGELGFLCGPISPEYGGSGLDYLSYTLISEELGRADSSVRGFLAVHGSLVSLCLNDWGTEAQKAALSAPFSYR
ncbi:MAG: acyl-CoA dehydrogenase family protein [Candidatus Promineifilaceae bacterium]